MWNFDWKEDIDRNNIDEIKDVVDKNIAFEDLKVIMAHLLD